MLRKTTCALLAFFLIFTSIALAKNPTEVTMVEKLTAVERVIYGAEQNGSLVDRVAKLERDMYGRENSDVLQDRIDRLFSRARNIKSSDPSFLTELNAAEWTLLRSVSTQPIPDRVANLEKVMWGSSTNGPMEIRLKRLLKVAYASGRVDVAPAKLDKDSLVKIKINVPIDTQTARVGDAVGFEVAEDVYVGNCLVIAKGAGGSGRVIKTKPARNFGRDAKLEVAFENVEAMDGSTIHTLMGDKAKAETLSKLKAAGASVTGMLLLGPVGLLGGAFVKGQEVVIPAGAELYVQIEADTNVYGVNVR
ncbi:MAG: hypothetical protein H6Q74_3243 [Firmicutes bacterium]|nr:hypothetical protein [Bacillota bacterium]